MPLLEGGYAGISAWPYGGRGIAVIERLGGCCYGFNGSKQRVLKSGIETVTELL